MTKPTNYQFGKYRVEAELGRGGFGAVFQAVDVDLERAIALKILDPLLMQDATWVMNFRREARVMARLEHPHIVPIHEIGEEAGRLYIAMKLIDGGNLATYIKQKGTLPWEETVRLLQEIAAALDFAHERQVAHRDLKPGNILLGADGKAALTDFGFARLITDNSMSVSISGGIVGTPAYIAPEVWEGKTVDKRADIYALGCILYEMATGQALFQGDSAPAIMLAHFKPLSLPESWPSGVPASIRDVLQTALNQEPAARYASAGEMIGDLRRLSADKLAEPYRQLEAAIAAQQWEPALALALAISDQNADYRDTQALKQKAIAGQEQAQRAAWAAQWRQQAEEALTAGNVKGAQAAALRWQEVAPGNKQAGEFLAKLEQAGRAAVPAAPPVKPAGLEPTPERKESAVAAPPPLPFKKAAPQAEAAEAATTTGRIWGRPIARTGLFAALALICLVGLIAAAAVALNNGTFTFVAAAPTTIMMPPVSGHLVEEWLREKDGMVMVYVPPPNTPFIQGSGLAAPTQGFWIDKYEVTNAQYQLCVNARACEPSAYANDNDWNGANQPVVAISWYDAAAYANWVGGALPTEEEWEYAAAGPERREYPWGNSFDGERLNFCDVSCLEDHKDNAWNDGYIWTAPVGSYPNGESWVGAADMAGNVWEWTDSWYDEAQTWRVLRGGSWDGDQDVARAAYRNPYPPGGRLYPIGFRVVVRRPPSP
jgi:hypothetical protein